MDIGRQRISFTLNGRLVNADVPAYWNLVDLLRHFGLFGARESCGLGVCGCCTVMVDGVAVSGCLTFALSIDGKSISTVENLDEDGQLSIVQQAFIDESALQCGFCTPGFVLMTEQLLNEHPDPTDDQIREYLSGNLCRCAAYPEIMNAVKKAGERRRRSISPNKENA